MKITPLDIRRKEFKRSMRGYSDEEVDIFLDEVADEFERLFQENMELQDRTHRLDEQIAGHAQLRDALEKTLVSAQMQAEELRANAHKESELILRDAELKARGIVNDSYGDTQKMQQSLVQLKLLEEDFRFKFRSLLEGYLRLLSQAPLAGAGAEPVVPEPVPAVSESPVVESRQPIAAPLPEAVEVTPTREAVAVTPLPEAVEVTPEATAPAEVGDRVFAPAMSAPPVFRPISDDTGAQASVYNLGGPCGVPGRYDDASRIDADAAGRDDVETSALEAMVVETPALETMAVESPTLETPAPDISPPVSVTEESTVVDTDTLETSEVEDSQDTAAPGYVPPPPAPWPEESAEEEPPRGFFFGRKMADIDDTFPGEDAGKQDKARDFEW